MVQLHDKDGNVLRTFDRVTDWRRDHVTYDNGGYPCKIYANAEAGEYFDDPDNPAPPPVPDPIDAMLDMLEGKAVIPNE